MRKMKNFRNGSAAVLMAMFLSPTGSVLLSWLPNTEADLRGYRIYYGTSLGNYPVHQDAGKATQYRVDNLEENRTYYFVVTAYDTAGNESAFSNAASVFITPRDSTRQQVVTLTSYNFPNPFKPREQVTQIRYELENPGALTIEIFDLDNSLVRTIVDGATKGAGEHTEDSWDGRDEAGNLVANGVYYCKIQSQDFTHFVRIVVVN